ncbi:MAG: hypothetical protein JWL69_4253 [Phycisphaerales bacterium]|jgi:hypothetical protein|nr:hypothetical protein [Phycisphaerales bacterium]
MLRGLALMLIELTAVVILSVISAIYQSDDRFSDRWDYFCWRVSTPIKGFVREIHDQFEMRRCRRIAGRCLKCNYDLIHNVSGVCPECGTPIHENRCPPT